MVELSSKNLYEQARQSSKGDQLKFKFTKSDVRNILKNEPYYPEDIKMRVEKIIYEQMRKYMYLF